MALCAYIREGSTSSPTFQAHGNSCDVATTYREEKHGDGDKAALIHRAGPDKVELVGLELELVDLERGGKLSLLAFMSS